MTPRCSASAMSERNSEFTEQRKPFRTHKMASEEGSGITVAMARNAKRQQQRTAASVIQTSE